MNTNLGKNAKNDFKKDFFKLMNIIIFGKAMKNVKKHRDNKLVTKSKKELLLLGIAEPNHHTMHFFQKIY